MSVAISLKSSQLHGGFAEQLSRNNNVLALFLDKYAERFGKGAGNVCQNACSQRSYLYIFYDGMLFSAVRKTGKVSCISRASEIILKLNTGSP